MNAFLFSHAPMTMTLADVLMLTGLNVVGLVTPFCLLEQVTHKLVTKDVGGGPNISQPMSGQELLTIGNIQLCLTCG